MVEIPTPWLIHRAPQDAAGFERYTHPDSLVYVDMPSDTWAKSLDDNDRIYRHCCQFFPKLHWLQAVTETDKKPGPWAPGIVNIISSHTIVPSLCSYIPRHVTVCTPCLVEPRLASCSNALCRGAPGRVKRRGTNLVKLWRNWQSAFYGPFCRFLAQTSKRLDIISASPQFQVSSL